MFLVRVSAVEVAALRRIRTCEYRWHVGRAPDTSVNLQVEAALTVPPQEREVGSGDSERLVPWFGAFTGCDETFVMKWHAPVSTPGHSAIQIPSPQRSSAHRRRSEPVNPEER